MLQRSRRFVQELAQIRPANLGADHFPFEPVAEFSIEPLPEIVQGILGVKSVIVIADVPTAGKTFFGINLAVHVAAGCSTWFGQKINGGPVLYVGAEAPGSVKLRARTALVERFPGR